MAIPSQPTTNISLGPTLAPTQRSIASEFGDSAPYSMSEFYRNGGKVPNSPTNSGIPTSGAISMGQFNGASASTPLSYTISADTTNLNLLTYATQQAPAPTRYIAGQPGYAITFTVNPGVLVSTTTLGDTALITGANDPVAGWHPDVTITLVNQGAIVGAGGPGGIGPNNNLSGHAGGTAIVAQRAITIQNAGTVAGGGGGGGVGAGVSGYSPSTPTSPGHPTYTTGGPGGGGAGRIGGIASPTAGNASDQPIPGGISSPGPGQPGAYTGGAGGGLGQAGQTGQQGGDNDAKPGGIAGYYSKGDSNITWQATGTRQGQVSPGTQTSQTPLTYPFTANTQNLNLVTYATQQAPVPTRYVAGTPGYRLSFQIGPDVLIGSTGAQPAAILSGANGPTGFHPDVEIEIINQGAIVGAGGTGGGGRSVAAGQQGTSGGTALSIQRLVVIQNAGTIAGGGGGGGAGGGFPNQPPGQPGQRSGGGGGGGAGRNVGQGGQPATNTPTQPALSGQPGTTQPVPGGISQGGAGGTTSPAPNPPAQPGGGGGAGGGLGQAGQAGQAPGKPAPVLTAGQGGAAGYYVVGNPYVYWQATGTRQGQSS